MECELCDVYTEETCPWCGMILCYACLTHHIEGVHLPEDHVNPF